MNTGIDPLLEILHETPGSGSSIYNSRILLKFDVTDIENRVNTNKISNNAKYYLSLITADVREIPQEYKIYAYPLSSSWTNGTGRYTNLPFTTDGVSWKYRSSKLAGKEWDIPPGIVNYEWDQWFNNGQLISVHKSGTFFAYSIQANSTGKVRVFHKKLSEKILLKSFTGRVVDLSFAHYDLEVLLGCLDETGCLQVFKIYLEIYHKIQFV